MYLCGWTDFRGLMEPWFRCGGMSDATVSRMLSIMGHVAPQTCLEELEHCLDLLRRGELQPVGDTREWMCGWVEGNIRLLRNRLTSHP